MRNIFGFAAGVILVLNLGATQNIGVIDSHQGGGISGTAGGNICLDNNALQLDDTCAAEYITGSGDVVDIYQATARRMRVSSSIVDYVAHDFQGGGTMINFNGGLYGKIGYVADDGLHICTTALDGYGNNTVAVTNNSNCTLDHDISTLATNPTLRLYSATAVTSDNTQWGSIYHDGGSLTISTGTGPLHVATGIRGEIQTSDPCAGGKYPAMAIFASSAGFYCFCNLSNADKQLHSPADDCTY